MAIFVRDGMAFIRTPKRDSEHDPVPEDFLVLLGVCGCFRNPEFRQQCLDQVKIAAKAGHLAGIVDYNEEPLQ